MQDREAIGKPDQSNAAVNPAIIEAHAHASTRKESREKLAIALAKLLLPFFEKTQIARANPCLLRT